MSSLHIRWGKYELDGVYLFNSQINHLAGSNNYLGFKLKQPVSNLISTLAKIKYKDWEFEFTIDQKLDKISFQLNKENQYGTDDQNLKDSLNLESNSEITEETHSHYNEKTSIKGDNDLLLKMEMIRLYGAVKNLYEKVSEKMMRQINLKV